MDHYDYFVFVSMVVFSLGLGIANGGKKSGGASQFIHGGGNMNSIPVSLSMIASFLSSITILGQPAEVYMYGPVQWLFGIAFVAVIPIVGNFMVPMFREKKYTSAYQYFGERFSRRVQFITSVLFTVNTVIYLSLVLYAPAMAVNQATGMNTLLLVTIMYAVCITYTTLGGIKAVVWTDAFQILVTFASLIFILMKGTVDIGGFQVVWDRNNAFNRTTFIDFSFDFTQRYTSLSVVIGLGFFHVAMTGANQYQVQRFTLVSSKSDVKRMLWANVCGWSLIVFLCTYSGMLIFAAYSDCDPLRSQKIRKADQLFPLYILEHVTTPGVQGLFLSGIFSAGLSTVSTGMNSLAAIWYAELEGSKFQKNLTESESGRVVISLTLVMGILSYLPVFFIPYLGGLVPLAISFSSIFCGGLFALFMLGMLTKVAEEWGALVGLLSSCILFSWLQLTKSAAMTRGLVINDVLPTSIEKCSLPFNVSISPAYNPFSIEGYAPWHLRISHTWYCLFAAAVAFTVGITISFVVRCLEQPKPKKVDILLEHIKETCR